MLVYVMFQINADILLQKKTLTTTTTTATSYKSHGDITDGRIHFLSRMKISENGDVKIVTLIMNSDTRT